MRRVVNEQAEKPKPYYDVEWQANSLAGMILVPNGGMDNLSPDEIKHKYLVSDECATYRLIQKSKMQSYIGKE